MAHLRWRFWMPLVVAGLLPSSLWAQDHLFVFHAGTTASVYDSRSFEVAGTPTVGLGAVHAVGVPDPAAAETLLKTYVITTNTVVVLEPEPPFAVRTTHSLLGNIPDGERSGLLTPDGAQLLVIAGESLHVFDALDPADPSPDTINLGVAPNHLTVLSSSERAYVSFPGSTQIRIIDLTRDPARLLDESVFLPLPPDAISAAPNGAGLYAAAPGALYEISPVRGTLSNTIPAGAGIPLGIGFNPDPPVDQAFVNQGATLTFFDIILLKTDALFRPLGSLTKAISPGNNLVYFWSDISGRIYRGEIEGASSRRLEDPDTGIPFPLPAVDAELDAANLNLFVAFGDTGELVRLNSTATTLWNQVVPALAPTGIAVVEGSGGAPSRLEIYGGNDQIALTGTMLPRPLAVRAIASNFRGGFQHEVTFEADADNVEFDPETAITNLSGVAETHVTVPTNNVFQVDATVVPGDFTVTFDVNTGIAGATGLEIEDGDFQITEAGTPFPRTFVVRAVSGGIPLVNLDLTITPNSSIVTCPGMVTTDDNGRGIFTCTAGSLLQPGLFEIDVEDGVGRSLPDPFHAKVVPTEEQLPRPQRLIEPPPPTPITGIVGELVEGAIEFSVIDRFLGFPVGDVGIALESGDDVLIEPPLIVTNPNGFGQADVMFGCTIGAGEITATMHSPGLPVVTIPFIVDRGTGAAVRKEQGDNQSGSPGETLDLALRIRVTDGCNNATGGVPVSWTIAPPGAATLRNAFTQTNTGGEASALVELGNQGGPFTVTSGIDTAAVVFNLAVVVDPAQIDAVVGDGQTVMVGQPADRPLVVEVRDVGGLPAAGVAVEFTVTGGSATLRSAAVSASTVGQSTTPSTIVLTNAQGQAGVELLAGSSLDPITVEARAGDAATNFNIAVAGRTPAVSAAGFVNAASFDLGWAPGGAGSIFGTGLMEGIEGIELPATAPFPTTFRGVQVLVENIPAPILGLANINGQEQINIQVPFEVPAPADNVVVTIVNNGSSATFPGIRTFRAQPGIFEFTIPEGKFASAQHADFSLIEPSNPARPGEVIILYLTAGGPTTPAVGTNQPGPVPPASTVGRPIVFVDRVEAEVLGSFYAPGAYTLYQINLVVPPDAVSGNLAIQVNIDGIPSQEAVIPVQR